MKGPDQDKYRCLFGRIMEEVVPTSARIAEAENRKKAGNNFYLMDEQSIVTIWKELSNDFFSLAESYLRAVRRLVDRLDDNQLGTQLQFEKYERERYKQRPSPAVMKSNRQKVPQRIRMSKS